jgi:hypothetical protein
MERLRRLCGRRTPHRRLRFVDRGQFDAADADMHLGGFAAAEWPMCARRFRNGPEWRHDECGRRSGMRRGRDQGRRCRHGSGRGRFCRRMPRGHSDFPIPWRAHRVGVKRRLACVMVPRREEERWHPVRNAGLAPRRTIGHVGWCRHRSSRCWWRARRLADGRLGHRRRPRMREPSHGPDRGAPPERLRRKIAQEAAHAVTMPKYAARRCSLSASTSRSLQP